MYFMNEESSERFPESSVVPSFLVSNVENEVSLAHTTLVKEPDRYNIVWQDNSCRVGIHERNSKDAVRGLGTIIQSIFYAQSGASIRLTVWKWSG